MACGCGDICSCYLSSSDTIGVTGSGTVVNPWVPVVITDPDGGLQAGVDGVGILLDPAANAPVTLGVAGLNVDCCPTAVSDSDTINFSVIPDAPSGGAVTGEVLVNEIGGIAGGEETAVGGLSVKIDGDPDNAISVGANGLFVSASGSGGGGGLVPPGTVFDYAGSIIPAGYIPCDGDAPLIATYPELYNAIGFQYTPGAPGTNPGGGVFYLPDTRGRTTFGVDDSGAPNTLVDALGDNDGLAVGTTRGPNHTHTGPSHSHGIPALTQGNQNVTGTTAGSGLTGAARQDDGNVPTTTTAAFEESAALTGTEIFLGKVAHVHLNAAEPVSGTATGGSTTASTTDPAGTGATGSSNPGYIVFNKIIKT